MIRNPPASFIPTSAWKELLPDEQPSDHVPVIFGREEFDKTVIGYISVNDVPRAQVAENE